MVRWSTSWCAADRALPSRWRRPATRPSRPVPIDWLFGAPRTIGPYFEGVLTTAAATAAGVLINDYVGLSNISLVFVVPVLVAAARHGLVPSLWVSGLSVLCFNFFFLPPLYQFTIADPANVVALFFFMFVAVAASALGTRTRAQAEAARREARTTAELYAFSRKIAGVIELDDLLWIVVTHLARLMNAEIAILMPEKSRVGDRQAGPARRLPARQRVQRGRPRRGALVVGRRAADRPRHRHPAGRALAVHADPHQPLVDRRDRRAVHGRCG